MATDTLATPKQSSIPLMSLDRYRGAVVEASKIPSWHLISLLIDLSRCFSAACGIYISTGPATTTSIRLTVRRGYLTRNRTCLRTRLFTNTVSTLFQRFTLWPPLI